MVEFMTWSKAAQVEEMIRQLEATRIRGSVHRQDMETWPYNLVLEQPIVESQGEWMTINHERLWFMVVSPISCFCPVRQSLGSCRQLCANSPSSYQSAHFIECRSLNNLTWITMRKDQAKRGHWRQQCWRDHVPNVDSHTRNACGGHKYRSEHTSYTQRCCHNVSSFLPGSKSCLRTFPFIQMFN